VTSAPALPPVVVSMLGHCDFPPAGTRLTCAVSGGADSLALVVLATAAGCSVDAVHVDHGLRPGSAGEADVVAQAMARLGATFHSERVTVADGPNVEARARAARFSVLPPGTATGHTMEDQAETVLANLLRGTGLDGLAAMRRGPTHPLLGLRRADTRRVCTEAGLSWIEDPSNDDPRYLRNRVRHELLPLCAEIAGRDPVPLLARLSDVVGEEAVYLDRLAADAIADPTDARALAAAARPLARRAVRRWLREEAMTAEIGGSAGPGEHYPPTLADVERVLDVASGRVVATEVTGGRRVRRRAGRLGVGAPGSGKVGAVPTEEMAQVVSEHLVPEQGVAEEAPAWASPVVGPVVVSASQIADRVAELGAAITADFAGEPPLLVGVLKGAMTFMSDLSRAIELPVDVDFMAVSSYGSATRTSGVVRIVKDLDAELTGRRVLVVEDIIDSGLTLNYLRKYLHARRPASVDVCALLVKEGEQRVDLDLRYVGFTIPSAFVVGYGLDVSERYRNLAGVHLYLGDGS
jgi:hypoxanthine phosphoribosyltransferase